MTAAERLSLVQEAAGKHGKLWAGHSFKVWQRGRGKELEARRPTRRQCDRAEAGDTGQHGDVAEGMQRKEQRQEEERDGERPSETHSWLDAGGVEDEPKRG